jgi:hypothetical protein
VLQGGYVDIMRFCLFGAVGFGVLVAVVGYGLGG